MCIGNETCPCRHTRPTTGATWDIEELAIRSRGVADLVDSVLGLTSGCQPIHSGSLASVRPADQWAAEKAFQQPGMWRGVIGDDGELFLGLSCSSEQQVLSIEVLPPVDASPTARDFEIQAWVESAWRLAPGTWAAGSHGSLIWYPTGQVPTNLPPEAIGFLCAYEFAECMCQGNVKFGIGDTWSSEKAIVLTSFDNDPRQLNIRERFSGAAASGGSVILAPYNVDVVGVFSVASGSLSLVDIAVHFNKPTYRKFSGAVAIGEQVIFAPHFAEFVGVFDAAASRLSQVDTRISQQQCGWSLPRRCRL